MNRENAGKLCGKVFDRSDETKERIHEISAKIFNMGTKKILTSHVTKQLVDVSSKTKKPPMYRVVLVNDDYTPMNFVVEVLEEYFLMNAENAQNIMLQVHKKGQAVCGVFTRDVAETKVMQVSDYAKLNEYPLLCVMEEM